MATNLVGPDGREYHIPDDNPETLKQALASGFRPLTEEAPRTLGEKLGGLSADATESVNAGLLGAAQGVSANLYGAYLGHHGADETPEEAAHRKAVSSGALLAQEEHPAATLVGNLAGAVASPINKVGGAIEGLIGAGTAAARIAGGAAGSGAVGALFGAGNALSDAALGDHELTAQKLLADGGLGALIGTGAGGLFGLVSEGAKAVAPALKKAFGAAQEALEDFAPNRALKAAGATQTDLKYLGEDKARAVGNMLLEDGHLGVGAEAPTAKGVLESVLKKQEEVGAIVGKAYEAADAAGAKPDYMGVIKRLDEFEEALSPLERDAIASDVAKARKAAATYGEEDGGFRSLQELKKDLQARAKWGNNQGEEVRGGLRRQLSGVVRDELDKQLVPQLGSDLGKAFTEANEKLSLLYSAERVAQHGVERLGGNASFGLRDLGLAVGAGLGQGNPVTGLVTAIASKTMRERGQGVIARLAHQIAESPQLATTAESFARKAGEASQVLGKYAPILAEAAQRSPAEAMATHMVLAQTDPHYQQAAQLAGFTPETPAEQQAALKKAHGLASMAAAAQHQDKEIERHIDAVFKGAKAPSSALKSMGAGDLGGKRMRRSVEDAHLKHLDDIRQLSANPEALIDRVTANLGNGAHVAPGVAGAMTATAQRAVQYLAGAGEQPLKAGPLAPDWHHNNAERFAFAKKLEAVTDPMSVLRHASAGTLTEEQVEAFHAVYPELAREVASRTLERMAAGPKGVPYRARLMLGLLTGTDPDGTMGEAIARNQAAIQLAGQKPSDSGAPSGPSGGKASPSRADKLSLAKRTALPSQSRETREE